MEERDRVSKLCFFVYFLLPMMQGYEMVITDHMILIMRSCYNCKLVCMQAYHIGIVTTCWQQITFSKDASVALTKSF